MLYVEEGTRLSTYQQIVPSSNAIARSVVSTSDLIDLGEVVEGQVVVAELLDSREVWGA